MSVSFYPTIAEIAKAIRNQSLSPVEITGAHLKRIESLQPKLNAFVHFDPETALAQARIAEQAVMRGSPLSSLHGIPVTIKSCIDVVGWPCPAGSVLRKSYVPAQDAPLVERLKAAGAVRLGNTNTPEFLMAYETDNSLSGKTSNPWNLSYSSGGSSGGEAAAIASGCSVAGVGSDGGGSIRVPAHFCGICGLKPTPGRIPATGHYPPGDGAFSWIGVVGPMARNVADVRALFEVMAGPDAGDALSSPIPIRNISENELHGLHIGLLESDAFGSTTPEIFHAVQRAAKLLSENDFVVEPFPLADLDQALEFWWFFFGNVVGHLIRSGVAGQESSISPMLREYLSVSVPEKPITFDRFLKACTDRDLLRAQILCKLANVPILLSPVSAGPAFRHGEGNWQPGIGYRETMRYSQWLNLLGFPGLSVPMGTSADGLPIGVQLIGRPHEEELLLAVAESLEQSRGPWQPPPISVI